MHVSHMLASREEFMRDAVLFCDAFHALKGDTNNGTPLTKWELQGEQPGDVYVTHPPILCEVPNYKDLCNNNSAIEYEEDTCSDPDTVPPPIHRRHVEWRFSIVFSDTWTVPVLYFTVKFADDGTPLLRSQVWDVIPCDEKREFADTWDFVSYEEHPMTGEPSFFLHPCQTARRLTLLQANQPATSPLLSWTAMIFPAVGFRIPTRTFCRVQQWIAEQRTIGRTKK